MGPREMTGPENGSEYMPKGGCYFCEGSHRASESPELGKLAAMIGNFARAHKGDTGETACIGGMRLESKPKEGDSKAYLGAMQMDHGGSKKCWTDIVEEDDELQNDVMLSDSDDAPSRGFKFAVRLDHGGQPNMEWKHGIDA
ncbi:hypothetical protein A4A49_13022 [Nicotiana attenuata]|uniref:Uncharacterized protein n=1 Tax=Nicotiana attenuata TaxID=49451 RepID=A0A314KZ13_NICAT|nr:hypothetical protein A4A49_13022 [Nicotiana attenuata]